MKEERIQTLHPEKGKKNRSIPVENYKIVKSSILKILNNSEPTHTELVAQLTQNLKDCFQDNISWYTMTVKLDLEARGIIERTRSRPEKYRIKETKRT